MDQGPVVDQWFGHLHLSWAGHCCWILLKAFMGKIQVNNPHKGAWQTLKKQGRANAILAGLSKRKLTYIKKKISISYQREN